MRKSLLWLDVFYRSDRRQLIGPFLTLDRSFEIFSPVCVIRHDRLGYRRVGCKRLRIGVSLTSKAPNSDQAYD